MALVQYVVLWIVIPSEGLPAPRCPSLPECGLWEGRQLTVSPERVPAVRRAAATSGR
jgi:hypothetical protein